MTHEDTYREKWIASRQGWIERSVNWSRMENVDIASGDRSVERCRERDLRRGARASIRRSASEQVACVTTGVPTTPEPPVLMSSVRI